MKIKETESMVSMHETCIRLLARIEILLKMNKSMEESLNGVSGMFRANREKYLHDISMNNLYIVRFADYHKKIVKKIAESLETEK